jgi:hypothetical protein
MRLSRKRALAPEALSLGQAPRSHKQIQSAPPVTLAQALDTLEATMLSIDAIGQALSEARELVEEAQRTEARAKRALLAERHGFLRDRIDELAASCAGARNLIGSGRDTLELSLDAEGRERLLVAHFNLTAGRGGLGLSHVKNGFAQAAEIERGAKELEAARARLKAVSEVLRQSAMRVADQLKREAAIGSDSAGGAGREKPRLTRSSAAA